MNSLIRKFTGVRSRRKKFRMRRRRPAAMIMLRAPRTFYGGKVVPFKCEIAIPVYIFSGTGPVFTYSFSTISTLLYTQLFNFATPGYAADIANMFNAYLYYCINGVKISFTRSVNAALTTVFQLPALYVDLVHELSNTQVQTMTSRTVAESDTHLEVQVLNTVSKPVSKYYSYGRNSFHNLAGEASVGKGCWITTDRTPIHNLILGYLDLPQLSSPTEQPKIGSVLCTVYMQFCKRLKLNNW
jgi:hypothetical protein